MNILLSYTSNPMTTASYLEKALRKICGVITHGPVISKDMLEQWDLLAVANNVRNHQIPYLNGDLKAVSHQLPSGWEPDVFLYIDSGLHYTLQNTGSLNCLRACYLIDSHLAFDFHLKLSEEYDVIFTAHKPAVMMFKERGIENVYWLPPACDPETHGRKSGEKLFDIGFVGTLNPELNAERVRLFNVLKQQFNAYYERCFLERMAEVFSQSRIVFHHSVNSGLAMRIFEVMASGSMLLADEAKGSGLMEFFQDRKQMVIYRNEKELVELADYYLRHDDERREISAEGMKTVLNEHTYLHRAKEMIRTLSIFLRLRGIKTQRM